MRAGGSGQNSWRLASAIGVEFGALPVLGQQAIRNGVRLLAEALAAGTVGNEALDDWIRQHLVDRTDALLITAAQRKAALALQRDKARRGRNTTQGWRQVQLKVSAAASVKLKLLADQWTAERGRPLTAAAMMEEIIDREYAGTKARSPKHQKAPAKRTDVHDTEPDLLSGLPQTTSRRKT